MSCHLHTLPNLALPWLGSPCLPCRAVPCPTEPCHALPSNTVSGLASLATRFENYFEHCFKPIDGNDGVLAASSNMRVGAQNPLSQSARRVSPHQTAIAAASNRSS